MSDDRSRTQAAVEAVAEVGNPTIIATLTVIVALLPMLFVSGLMGPYMAPIPANASAAMLFSFFVAVMLTPWLMMKFAGRGGGHSHAPAAHGGALGRIYVKVARPFDRFAPARLGLSADRRRLHNRFACTVLYLRRYGETASIRQQGGIAGACRSAGRVFGRGHGQGSSGNCRPFGKGA